MNITIARNRALITEIRMLTAAVNRLADLKELELQSVHRITTRTTAATPADLEQTQVAYNDPAFDEAARTLERRAGRSLTEEESAKLMAALAEVGDGDDT